MPLRIRFHSQKSNYTTWLLIISICYHIPVFLITFLKEIMKYAWQDHTSSTIQWTWFKKAIQRPQASSRVTLTKLIYNQLATQHHKSITGGSNCVLKHCPYCPDDIPESFEHMLRCKHPAAHTFRTHILSSIASTCRNRHAPTTIQDTLHLWLSQWLRGTNPNRTQLDPKAAEPPSVGLCRTWY